MKKVFLLAILGMCTLAAPAQLIPNPFGFYLYEKADLAKNKVQQIFEYTVSGEEDEAYGAGYMPDDSLYSGVYSVHASGWLIEMIEKEVSYDESYFLGSTTYVYAGPNGLVSQMEFRDEYEDGYKVVFQYDKGVLTSKSVVATDPTEEVFTYQKGRIVSSMRFMIFPMYDDDGNFTTKKVPTGRHEYVYDEKGNLVQIKSYYRNLGDDSEEYANVSIEKRKYLADNRLVKVETFNLVEGNEEPAGYVEFIYNDNKLLVQKKVDQGYGDWPKYFRYVYVTGN